MCVYIYSVCVCVRVSVCVRTYLSVYTRFTRYSLSLTAVPLCLGFCFYGSSTQSPASIYTRVYP